MSIAKELAVSPMVAFTRRIMLTILKYVFHSTSQSNMHSKLWILDHIWYSTFLSSLCWLLQVTEKHPYHLNFVYISIPKLPLHCCRNGKSQSYFATQRSQDRNAKYNEGIRCVPEADLNSKHLLKGYVDKAGNGIKDYSKGPRCLDADELSKFLNCNNCEGKRRIQVWLSIAASQFRCLHVSMITLS